MYPSANELKYFIEVSRTLNISRASERLGISQPSLSIAIQRLEQSFGTPLLIRSKSGVKLTKAGQKLIVRARDLLESWEKIRAEAIKDDTTISGSYTIGCHISVANYALPRFLPKLLAQHPNLEINLSHNLSRNITEEVISFKTDFGIVVNPIQHPDLVIKALTNDEVTLWTAKKASKLQNPDSDESVLIADESLLQTQSLLKQLKKKKINFSRIIRTSSLEVICSLVHAGVGIGVLPGLVATKDKAMQLKALSGTPIFLDKHCLIYRADAQKSFASQHIIKAISQSFSD